MVRRRGDDPHNGGVIDHVDIRVSDRDASERFYDSFLAALGAEPVDQSEQHIDWGPFTIAYDGKPVARRLHLAFAAPSPELAHGVLRDPDGNTVEAVFAGPDRRPGAIEHVRLVTRDVAAARRFYVATGLVAIGGAVSYVAGEPPTEHVHLAFRVDTDAAVDAFHRAAIAAGYTDNGAPGERAAYHPGYYGAFVLDPDGHNIEAVNHNRT